MFIGPFLEDFAIFLQLSIDLVTFTTCLGLLRLLIFVRLCRLHPYFIVIFLADVEEFIRDANLQFPLAEKSQFAQVSRDTIAIDAFSLLLRFSFKSAIEGHTLAPGNINGDLRLMLCPIGNLYEITKKTREILFFN